MIWSRAYKTLHEIPREMNTCYLTIPEAVRLSTIPETEIRAGISSGDLRFFARYSGRKLIRVESLRSWVSLRTIRTISACSGDTTKKPKPRKSWVCEMSPAEREARLRKAAKASYKRVTSEKPAEVSACSGSAL